MRIAKFFCALLLALGTLTIPAQSRAQVAVGISIRTGPPALPVYVQPVCPEPNYIWIPGYWAYAADDYYWVPGTWVLPPESGLLWTPGYWAFSDGFYLWNEGYWGPTVGFYGGINYGFGYPGAGFYGGYWRGGAYFYNRAVTNVNVIVVHNNTYNAVVNNNTNVTRVSFNGGPEGITARPTATETEAARGPHVAMTSEQTRQRETARGDRRFLASENHGRPKVTASPRTAEFGGRAMETRPSSATPLNPGRGNADRQQQQQRELDQLQQKQNTERQKTEQRQVQEQQKAPPQQQQQLNERHQQQNQQMQQKHDQQTQQLQEQQQRDNQKQGKQQDKENQRHGRGQ